ncbi:MAG: protein-ADP-ribose hydrolase [Desulfobacula sp.]|jgi:O-acetyl-ADP-ribose deacetylase (regulator of RNase III)
MLDKLIAILCAERGETPPEFRTEEEKADYFRSLCNIRPPWPVSPEFLELQDQYLTAESLKRGIVDVSRFAYKDAVALWQGDITRLSSDAIVNACNSALLGCFAPLHNCIDNIIHSRAGVQVRLDCDRIMQGEHLPNGEVVVTSAYNLPSRFIFHTVGPVVQGGTPSEKNAADLKKCYMSCLDKALEMDLTTIAFCCLSTGVYGYPKHLAAKAAVAAVRDWQGRNHGLNIIFNVFPDEDKHHYERELSR